MFSVFFPFCLSFDLLVRPTVTMSIRLMVIQLLYFYRRSLKKISDLKLSVHSWHFGVIFPATPVECAYPLLGLSIYIKLDVSYYYANTLCQYYAQRASLLYPHAFNPKLGKIKEQTSVKGLHIRLFRALIKQMKNSADFHHCVRFKAGQDFTVWHLTRSVSLALESRNFLL